MVELQPSKLDVAGSNPAARSTSEPAAGSRGEGERSVDSRAARGECTGQEATGSENAHVAQSAERVLGKDEVISSILIVGSNQAGDEVGSKQQAQREAGFTPAERSGGWVHQPWAEGNGLRAKRDSLPRSERGV